jgi:hypothetical protein
MRFAVARQIGKEKGKIYIDFISLLMEMKSDDYLVETGSWNKKDC